MTKKTDDKTAAEPASSRWPQGSESPYRSPLASSLEASQRPSPSTVCEDCPAAIWYGTPQGLRCYCKMMSLHSWGTEEFDKTRDPVMACDGREMAIAQLLKEQEEG